MTLRGGRRHLFSEDTLIKDVIAARPQAAQVFEKHGLGCASCLAAEMESLSQAAHIHEVSLGALLSDLNALENGDYPRTEPRDG